MKIVNVDEKLISIMNNHIRFDKVLCGITQSIGNIWEIRKIHENTPVSATLHPSCCNGFAPSTNHCANYRKPTSSVLLRPAVERKHEHGLIPSIGLFLSDYGYDGKLSLYHMVLFFAMGIISKLFLTN